MPQSPTEYAPQRPTLGRNPDLLPDAINPPSGAATMGCCQTYHCESCGLQATVSGGRDRGFYTETETRYCSQCAKLVDVGIRLWCKELLPGLLPASRVRHLLTAEKEFGLCPACKSPDGHAWVAGDACPKCGGIVQVVAGDPVEWI